MPNHNNPSHGVPDTGRREFLVKISATAVSAGVAWLVPGLAEAEPARLSAADAVTVTNDGETYTLANGILTAMVEKKSGAVLSVRYKGLDLLSRSKGSGGYWSLPGTDYSFGTNRSSSILLDPRSNGGERATISCRFGYDGSPNSVPADVEFRYSLGRGDQGLYLQAIWSHKAGYPAFSIPVGRFAAKLNDQIFDWMTIDSRRNLKMITAYDWNHGTPLNMKEARLMNTGVKKGQVEHKYDYSAVQFDTPAYGWSSTERHVGLWMVTADYEYM
jgi:rhamnogalacturonan endolyase